MTEASRPRAAPRRPSRPRQPAAVDIWKTVRPLPDLEPVSIPDDVLALIRSLGDQPLKASVDPATYFERAIERASAVAIALALSADLLTNYD
jgi:hypothetical protein